MQFGVRKNAGRYDNLDYDYDNDNDNDNGAKSTPDQFQRPGVPPG